MALAIASLLGIAGLSAFFHRAWHAPGPLMALLWAAVIGLEVVTSATYPPHAAPVSDMTLVLVVLAVSAFALSGAATRAVINAGRSERRWSSDPVRVPRWWDELLLWVPPVLLGLLVVEAVDIASRAPDDLHGFWVRLRYQLSEAGARYSVVRYGLPLATFASWYRLWRLELSPPTWRLRLGAAAAISIAFAFAFLMTGRSSVLFFGLFILGVLWLSPARRGRWLAGAVAVLAVVAVLAMGAFQGKTELALGHRTTASLSAGTTTAWQVVGPLRGFDSRVTSDLGRDDGSWLLLPLHSAGVALGWSTPADFEPLDNRFIYVPYPVNVWTLFHGPFHDGGLLSLLALMALWGMLHTWAHEWGRRGRVGGRYAYALMLFPLALSFKADFYGPLILMWAQYAAMFFLFVHILLRLRYVRASGQTAGDAS